MEQTVGNGCGIKIDYIIYSIFKNNFSNNLFKNFVYDPKKMLKETTKFIIAIKFVFDW